MLTRRQLVTGGGALAALAGLGLLFAHRPLPSLDSPFLGSSPRRTLQAAIEALLPSPERGELLANGVDTFLAAGDPLASAELRTALVVLEHAGLRRFSRLSLEQRRDRLRSWEASSIGLKRQIFQALRRTALFSNYSDPATWEAMGYDGTWVQG